MCGIIKADGENKTMKKGNENMTRYVLRYSDGSVAHLAATCDTDAELEALGHFEVTAVASDQWDAAGSRRLLIWESEADAADDPGENAVAQVVAVD